MNNLAELLKEHYDNHPGLEPRDAIKFLYQSSMGAGHLIADPCGALARLDQEWADVHADPDCPPLEPLGNGLCRLSLAACKAAGLEPKTLLSLFLRAARSFIPRPDALDESLELLYALPFPREALQAEIQAYRRAGLPMLSHSQAYREKFSPAYRVVFRRDADALPLLAAIDRRRRAQPRVLVALDGPCASGKSTLGAALADIYGCPLFHMDDFFLRPEQRTPERLDQPGGNVDYERFWAEILSPLSRGEAVTYRPYRCRAGALDGPVTVPPANLAVVEGVYALRPELRPHYDVTCFLTAPWPLREQRLLARGGPGCLERFQTQWIPLEDRYFQAFSVQEHCDVILTGQDA